MSLFIWSDTYAKDQSIVSVHENLLSFDSSLVSMEIKRFVKIMSSCGDISSALG